MFAFCAEPATLAGLEWLSCYLTTKKHLSFYASFGTVLLLIALTAPTALIFGFGGALAARHDMVVLRLFGKGYIAMVRGVPDIVFFLFVPIALDQGLEFIRHQFLCPADFGPIWRGNDFVVCSDAKLPLNAAPPIYHHLYGFILAVFAFALVFGAFAGNVLFGAMRAVPKAQIETALSFGMTDRQAFRRILLPQMWVYALPGLSNLWMILIKATPLLFLLGIQDIVYWARELGSSKTSAYAYPHPDWRVWYFGFLLIFYLMLTFISEKIFSRLTARLSRGQATLGGQKSQITAPAGQATQTGAVS